MAKLSAAQRKRIPKSQFGVPSKAPASGSYPMPDRSHAANAKARARQQLNAGRISRSTYNSIVAKANRKLNTSGQGARRGLRG